MPVSLYEHQIKAIEDLRNGCILCGGVGSGKSRTAIAYYFLKECKGELCINGDGEYKEPKEPKDLYIITTARKRDTLEWEAELPPFLLSTNSDICVCRIKIKVDSWNNIKKYTNVKDAFFIFDEQRVIGSGSWTKSFLKITKSNRWILLSATPGDTWTDYIPVFVANGFYKNRTAFIGEHVIFDRFATYPKVSRYLGTKKLIRLRDSILINMEFERDTKQIHYTVPCEYNKEKYKDILKTRWNPNTSMPIKNVSELCQLLRRIVNSDISRIEAMKDLTSKHAKSIVFYNFDYELDILRNLALDLSIPCAEWNGHIHQPIPDTDRWLYLVQYTAGAEGWNCVKTDCMVFYSENYSYRIMTQAAGRIDRMNTEFKTLYYYHLKSRAPIDLAISRCLKEKRNFNESRFIKVKK